MQRTLVGVYDPSCRDVNKRTNGELRTDEHLCIWCPDCGHVFSARCPEHGLKGEPTPIAVEQAQRAVLSFLDLPEHLRTVVWEQVDPTGEKRRDILARLREAEGKVSA